MKPRTITVLALGWIPTLALLCVPLLAQRHAPVTVTRLYTGADGKTHVEEYEVPLKELKAMYSGTWLWEKITFADVPSEDFLLLVDIKAHPAAASRKPGSIDKSWVSKFYLRK